MLKLWLQTGRLLAVACKNLFYIFTFPGSGAVNRFVITASVNQVSTSKNKCQAAKRLGNMTG